MKSFSFFNIALAFSRHCGVVKYRYFACNNVNAQRLQSERMQNFVDSVALFALGFENLRAFVCVTHGYEEALKFACV